MNQQLLHRSALKGAAEAGLLLGSWQLTGLRTSHPGGVDHPLGRAPTGQITYGPDGRMAVHLCRDAALEDAGMAEFTSYCGRYTVDPDAHMVTHHIEAGSMPGLAGSDQPRRFSLDGDRLRLSAVTPRGETELDWRRVCPDDAPPAGFSPLETPGTFPGRAGRYWVADRHGPCPIVGTRIGVEQSNSEGFAHGGFLLAFADFAVTIMIQGITLNLSADFLRPARIGDWVEARIVTRKRTSDLIFADAVATCNGRDALRISGLFKPFGQQP